MATESEAIALGYTRRVMADCAEYTLELLIAPDVDLDSTFGAFVVDDGKLQYVNGWLWTFEDIDSPAPCVTINFVRAGHPGLEC